MSSALGDRGHLSSPLGDPAKEDLPNIDDPTTTQNLPQTPQKPSTQTAVPQTPQQTVHSAAKDQAAGAVDQTAPRNLPDLPDVSSSSGALDDDDEEAPSNDDGDDGEMVPAAGRINDKGEVIDDDGNAIGRVTSGEPAQLVGFIVTQEGDVLDHDGGVVGKAEPLEDVTSELNTRVAGAGDRAYTTAQEQAPGQQVEDAEARGGGARSGLSGVLSGMGNVFGLGKSSKAPTEAAGAAAKGVTDAAGDVTGKTGDAAQGATGAVGETAEGVAQPVTDTVDDAAGGVTSQVGDVVEGGVEAADQAVEDLPEGAPSQVGSKLDVGSQADLNSQVGSKLDVGSQADLKSQVGSKLDVGSQADLGSRADLGSKADLASHADLDSKLDVGSQAGGLQDELGSKVEGLQDEAGSKAEGLEGDLGSKAGDLQEDLGSKAADLQEGELSSKAGDLERDLGSKAGELQEDLGSKADDLAEVEPVPIEIPEFTPSVAGKVLNMFEGPFTVADNGQVTDVNGKILGKLAEGQDFQDLIGKDIKGIDEHGNLLGDNETVLGRVTLVPEGTVVDRIKDEVPEAADRLDAIEEAKQQELLANLPDISILEGLNINKAGNVVDANGNPLGRVKEGYEIKKLVGKQPDAEGRIWDSRGNVIGEVEVLPEAVQNIAAPFEDFPDAVVDKDGRVMFEGRQVGVVVGDDWDKLIGKHVDADGDILDKNGNVIGKAERKEAEEPEPEPEPEVEQVDYSMLRDKKVNKMGNVVDDKGNVWGHVVQGILKHLIGKKVGKEGLIYNDAGEVIGKAEPLPDSEREDLKEPAPFEAFPNAVVGDKGAVLFNGEQIGIVVEGDLKKLKGMTVDADGDILDRAGNVLGRAERWEEEEVAPEPEPDRSALAGKRINKAGNAVDKSGDIYGHVVEGELRRLIGKMCDKEGCIRNEGGDVIGRAELLPEAEREGLREGPFTELPGCTVTKEGHVVTPGGDIVGRLIEGDPKRLFGRVVDDDGDICDKNGNVLGRAERWEPEEVPKDVNPMSGRKVNREGNVVDENGDLVGRLTSGDLSKCAGKKIDDDGDVVDGKGSILGHVSMLEDIPPPPEEPVETESEEDRLKREQLEQDRQIAGRICMCIEHSLDKIRPICRMITELIDKAERTPEEERDEEDLVKQVRPLIEEGGKILTEANGVIRGLDPDGRISANAKHKTAAREATPEEYRLADLLKELTGTVTETIDNAKRKIEDMPHAKKELNPLWGLLAEPLFQIIAAVGLLLTGVLGLVGKLLNGLGLGGLVNNLLGGLGLTRVLEGLGLGSLTDALSGQSKGKKKGSAQKKSGGLLGLGIL